MAEVSPHASRGGDVCRRRDGPYRATEPAMRPQHGLTKRVSGEPAAGSTRVHDGMATGSPGLWAIVGPGAIWRVGPDGTPHRQASLGHQVIGDLTDKLPWHVCVR